MGATQEIFVLIYMYKVGLLYHFVRVHYIPVFLATLVCVIKYNSTCGVLKEARWLELFEELYPGFSHPEALEAVNVVAAVNDVITPSNSDCIEELFPSLPVVDPY